jgi:hypothetical protein
MSHPIGRVTSSATHRMASGEWNQIVFRALLSPRGGADRARRH